MAGVFQGELTELTSSVYLASEPVSFLGLRLTATMTVVCLPGSELLVHSPIPLSERRRAAVEALGTVTHLYAPNTFHHSWIGEWSQAFPEARVHAPRALAKKRPDLRIDRAHDRDALGPLVESLDEIHIDGFLLEESVLLHRASGALIVADLVHNVGRPPHAWTKLYCRAMGFYDRVAISRMLRWTAFHDTKRAKDSIERLAACTFEHLVVGHGAPVSGGARAALLAAYAWLEQSQRPRLPAAPTPRGGYCG
jgi:hypothetical protein